MAAIGNSSTTYREIEPITSAEIEPITSSALGIVSTSTEVATRTLATTLELEEKNKETKPAVSSKKKQTKYEKWASPESNALMKAIPQHKEAPNPFTAVKIEVVTGENQFVAFWIPKFVLMTLSPHFKTVFSKDMIEKRSDYMQWVGTGTAPYIHPEAAVQVIQFAHSKCSIFDENACRSLLQLKQQFPKEFKLIFTDIIRLCSYFEIHDLKEKCEQFLIDEFTADIETKVSEYFQWACGAPPEAQEVFKSALVCMSAINRVAIYTSLISLAEADYSECSKEEQIASSTMLQECYSQILKARVSIELMCWDRSYEKEMNELCHCLVTLFPRFEFPVELITRLGTCIIIPERLKSPASYFVLMFFQCYHKANAYIPPGEGMKAEGKLKEFELFTQAMNSPERSRINSLSDFISKYPENILALIRRSVCYRQKGNFDAALKDLNRALELKPDYPFALASRGDCHRQKGNLDAALKDLNRALELKPDYPFALASRGDCHRQKGNLDAALKDFNRATELEPDMVFALARRGDCHRQKGNLDAALKDFNRATELEPDMVFALARRGDCHRQKGNLDVALKDLNRATELNPNDTFALAARGDCHRLKGNLDVALKDLNRATELNPNDTFALAARGDCHRLKGNFVAALRDFNRVVELNPQEFFALGRRGDCHRLKGNFVAALNDFNRATELNPKDVFALERRDLLLNNSWIDLTITCNVGEGNDLGICCEPSWGDEPIAFELSENRWIGQVPVGKEWKFVILQDGEVLRWEEGYNRTLDITHSSITLAADQVKFAS